MTREKSKVSASEKADQMDKKDVICPMILLVTKKIDIQNARAINYDLSWSPTIKLGDVVGAWRSAPQLQLTPEGEKLRSEKGYRALEEEHIAVKGNDLQARSHSLAFYKMLEEGKEKGLFSWDEDAYYFTHKEGVTARQEYQELVMTGQTKAQKRSWEGRFAELTGMSWEDLQEKFPELYGTKKAESTSETTEQKMEGEEETSETDTTEPTEDQLQKAASEIDSELEEEVAVAGVSSTEETVEGEAEAGIEEPFNGYEMKSESELIDFFDQCEHIGFLEDILTYERAHQKRSKIINELQQLIEKKVITSTENSNSPETITTFHIDEFGKPQEVKSDCITWKGTGGEQMTAYLVSLEDLDTEMFLTEGTHVIEGHTIEVMRKKGS